MNKNEDEDEDDEDNEDDNGIIFINNYGVHSGRRKEEKKAEQNRFSNVKNQWITKQICWRNFNFNTKIS